MTKWASSQKARLVQHNNSINIIQHINKLKDRNHIILSIDAEKAFDKFQHAFMRKILEISGIDATCLTVIKATHNRPIASVTVNGDKLRAFPYNQDQDKDVHSPFPDLMEYSKCEL